MPLRFSNLGVGCLYWFWVQEGRWISSVAVSSASLRHEHSFQLPCSLCVINRGVGVVRHCLCVQLTVKSLSFLLIAISSVLCEWRYSPIGDLCNFLCHVRPYHIPDHMCTQLYAMGKWSLKNQATVIPYNSEHGFCWISRCRCIIGWWSRVLVLSLILNITDT